MKLKKFIKKVERYIELSKEFEQKESDLFDVDPTQGLIYSDYLAISDCSNSISPIISGELRCSPKTRAEVIRSIAEDEAARADRYDEYKKLRSELSKYTQAYLEL
jgi:hypothetical protein